MMMENFETYVEFQQSNIKATNDLIEIHKRYDKSVH